MKKIEIAKRFLVGALVLPLVFTPISFLEIFSGEYFKVKAYEEEIISGYQEWTSDREIDGSVQIEPDATLVIKKGITVTFKEGSYLYIYGKLFAKGTKNNPVKFRREGIEEIAANEDGEYSGYQIYIQGEADFNNADISGGGSYFDVYLKGKNIVNRAYAVGESPVISVADEARLKMRNCYIHGNMGGIELYYVDGGNVRVYKTLFERNEKYDVLNSYSWGQETPDFRYNWWNSATGPEKTCFDVTVGEHCDYEKINGDIDFSNWLTAEDFKDPVIIIPGILGSEKKDGQWQIDPVFHTYDNLYDEFAANGYTPGKDLFTFPYEWRNSNVENAKLLKNKIAEIKNMENWPEVDIVTHSMGGLLAREYIESDYYSGDIDQLVMLGTPNNGAPEAYLKWEAGAFLANFEEIFMKYYFKHEAKEKGYADLFHYIQDKIPSVKELLPTYGYLYDVENNENLLEYPADYPFNDFLDDLNSQTMKEKLWQVELDKIIGNVENNNSTVAGFKVIQTDMGEYWKHGYPHGFEIPLGDRGVKWDVGDRTVPLKSARSENIFADEVIELDFSHRELPTYAQKDVLEILTGVRPESEVRHSLIRNILLVSVYSPIDIQVEAPDGKKIGKDFETGEIINEIDGAYYTGYETDNEFLTIPNPEDGEYKILTQGTGEGDYKIEAAKISEDENNPGQTIESSKDIIGTAETGSREEKSVQVLGNEVLAEAKDTTPPDITYVVSPSPNENGWNNTDVKVHFEAADGESGMDENNASRDIILEGEGGNQSASWTTADKAGNSATKNISGINIDKTAPVTEINFSGTEGKNDWYASDVSVSFGFSDNLSGTEKTFYALDNQDFQAGNQLAVTDEGEHNLKYYSQDLAGNIENVNTADFKLDKTAPVVKIISPISKNYPNDNILKIKYSVEDSTSPPDKIQKTISYDDQMINSDKIDLALEHLGNHSLAISAEDEAGNQNQTQTNFTIMADINSIISNVKHYFQLGLIKSRMAETALEVKLRNIKSKTRLLNVFESRWMPKWAKDRVIANMKREINRQVDDLIGKIQNDRKFKETIDQKAKELLTEGLEYIRP